MTIILKEGFIYGTEFYVDFDIQNYLCLSNQINLINFNIELKIKYNVIEEYVLEYILKMLYHKNNNNLVKNNIFLNN